MLRDLQPQRQQAQRERQPERQQVESELPVRGRPKVSHFSPTLVGEFFDSSLSRIVLSVDCAILQAFYRSHQEV